MAGKSVIPSVNEVAREALIVVAGAIVAAAIMHALPGLRAWIKALWQDTPQP